MRKNPKLVAKIVLILILGLVNGVGKGMPAPDVDRIADAIYVIEGGDKTKHPYGVLSVHVSNKAEARAICKRTIVNNYARWQKQKIQPDYFIFLADRYCPPTVDQNGNTNWRRNINKLLSKSFRDTVNKSH